MFSEVLARQFSDPALRDVQRMTADTYAVQHPGQESPVAIQSVCGHLMSLCVVLEKDAPYTYADQILQAAVRGKVPFSWLTPPPSMGDITVEHVHAAGSVDEHHASVHAWARSAWAAWADHHDIIRTWVARA